MIKSNVEPIGLLLFPTDFTSTLKEGNFTLKEGIFLVL